MKQLTNIALWLLAITGLVAAGMAFSGCASFNADAAFGTEDYYEGTAMGYRGMIHVRVGMEQGTITEISVIDSIEDRAVGGAAMEELTDLVLLYNTTELDVISGATETSKGFLAAIENAIIEKEE